MKYTYSYNWLTAWLSGVLVTLVGAPVPSVS